MLLYAENNCVLCAYTEFCDLDLSEYTIIHRLIQFSAILLILLYNYCTCAAESARLPSTS